MSSPKRSNPAFTELFGYSLAEIEGTLFHGRGIGLWLVHLIVQYSDGQLSFAKNDPRGSVVTVRLRTP